MLQGDRNKLNRVLVVVGGNLYVTLQKWEPEKLMIDEEKRNHPPT